jgi:hypothetical protein
MAARSASSSVMRFAIHEGVDAVDGTVNGGDLVPEFGDPARLRVPGLRSGSPHRQHRQHRRKRQAQRSAHTRWPDERRTARRPGRAARGRAQHSPVAANPTPTAARPGRPDARVNSRRCASATICAAPIKHTAGTANSPASSSSSTITSPTPIEPLAYASTADASSTTRIASSLTQPAASGRRSRRSEPTP